MSLLKIEQFGEIYRLVEYCASQPTARRFGVRLRTEEPFFDKENPSEISSDCNEGRFRQSVERAKARVRELALCNDWQYFCTFTLDASKQTRYDLEGFVKDFGNWIGNYNKKFQTKFEYVAVPEQHSDGAWHFHGLCRGIASASIITNKYGYLEIPYYSNRFGFINLSEILDKTKTATYVAKYITKATDQNSVQQNKHLFYSSRGLNGKTVLDYVHVDSEYTSDWYNEWCGVSWKTQEEVEQILLKGH